MSAQHEGGPPPVPRRHRLPDERPSKIHHFKVYASVTEDDVVDPGAALLAVNLARAKLREARTADDGALTGPSVPYDLAEVEEHLAAAERDLTPQHGVVKTIERDVYLIRGFYPNGKLGEIFVRQGVSGNPLAALVDAWCIMVSLGLQSGMPVDKVCAKYRGYGFEPSGRTNNPDISYCSSIIDYIVQYLKQHHGEEEE